MVEHSRITPGMQVLTSDGEFIGTVDHPGEDDFALRRLTGADTERVPALWVHRVDEHVHLNRTGAEAIAGWKSLKFTTSSGTAPAHAPDGAAAPAAGMNMKWVLWAVLAVVAILILTMLF